MSGRDPLRSLNAPARHEDRGPFAIDAGVLVATSILIAVFAALRLNVLGFLVFWFAPQIPTAALVVSSLVWLALYFRLIRRHLGKALWLLPTIAAPCLLALVTIQSWELYDQLPSHNSEPAAVDSAASPATASSEEEEVAE